MAVLDVRDVTSGYGEVQILWGTSLALEPGQLTTLVGSNGAGKTTLLRTVMGLLRPWSGQILFDGQDISRLPAHVKAEMGLILVPEGRQLFTDMTVEENLEMGATPRRARPHMQRNLERVYALFPRLKERARQKAGTLSGTVTFTVLIGWRMFPKHPIVGLLAGALVAFNPQFLFISASVNNDNLLTMLATMSWWQILRAMVRPDQKRQWAYVGGLIGASFLAKVNGGLLVIGVVGRTCGQLDCS